MGDHMFIDTPGRLIRREDCYDARTPSAFDNVEVEFRKFSDWGDQMRGNFANASRYFRKFLFNVKANIYIVITKQNGQVVSANHPGRCRDLMFFREFVA